MATDPRSALDRLIAAFEAHLDVVEKVQDEEAPAVLAAADTLAEAFETYDEAVYEEYGIDTPLVVYEGDDDDDDDEIGFDDLDEDSLGNDDDDDDDEVEPEPDARD